MGWRWWAVGEGQGDLARGVGNGWVRDSMGCTGFGVDGWGGQDEKGSNGGVGGRFWWRLVV